jgi:hypothetical protein
MTTQPKLRDGRRLLILLGLLALAPILMGPKPPPPPPEPPPPATCDGLTNDFDLDQDGLPDLVDCEGLSSSNGGLIDYPGCIGAPDGTAPNCTDHTLADVFAEVHKDTSTGISGFDDEAELGPGNAIPDDEVFSFATGSLAVNVHTLPPGSFDPVTRLVWQVGGQSQAGVVLVENATVGTSCPSFPLTTGISFLGNPNEFGEFEVYTRRIFQKIDCIVGPDADLKRQHLLNTSSHEFGHGGLRQAPDPSSYHQQTVGDCLMEAAIEPDRRNRLIVPTAFCSDTTEFDGDGTFACLPKTP